MNNTEIPIVFTITRNDATHYRIYTNDSRTNIAATVSLEGLFDMLESISKVLNKHYAVLFEVD